MNLKVNNPQSRNLHGTLNGFGRRRLVRYGRGAPAALMAAVVGGTSRAVGLFVARIDARCDLSQTHRHPTLGSPNHLLDAQGPHKAGETTVLTWTRRAAGTGSASCCTTLAEWAIGSGSEPSKGDARSTFSSLSSSGSPAHRQSVAQQPSPPPYRWTRWPCALAKLHGWRRSKGSAH